LNSKKWGGVLLKWAKIFKLISFLCFVIYLVGCKSSGFEERTVLNVEVEDNFTSNKSYKILHVMSYHTPWEWTETQLQGFQDVLLDLDIEYRVVEMDAKNFSSVEHLTKKAQEAIDIIDSWKPDLVFVSDDEALEYVATPYIDSDINFVFCGINKDPKVYGMDKSKNITGVLEIEHFVESANLLKTIAPDVKKVALVFDDSDIWFPVQERMKENLYRLPELEFVHWDTILTFDEFQEKMLMYQDEVDAIGLIGIFNFKDKSGENVHYRDVLEWTVKNSQLPDFSYWYDRATYGTLAVVSVSGYEQGKAAGKMARSILLEGRSPDTFLLEYTTKGQVLVSLARARDLGIKVDSATLLSSIVKDEYGWDVVESEQTSY
jgi:ABC-type uncharacterized transport system substrate-binding protein